MSNSEIPSSPDERSGDLSEIFKLGREGAVAAVQDLTGQTQTLESLDNLHADLMHHASLLADDWAKKYKSPCKAGCSFCCYMRVTANPVELLIIANNVQRTLSADRLNELRERLRKNVKKISPFSLREHAESKTPCAFLLPSGSCSIYEARPLNCRRWVSLSVDACEKNFLLPSETENIPLEGRTHAWVAGISEGLKDVLKMMDLDHREYELQSGLLRVLETPDALERWYRGDRIFEGCLTSGAAPDSKK